MIPSAQRLEQITAQFRVAFNRDIAPGHNAAVAALDAKYLAALNRSLEVATQVANLDEAVKLREERERIIQKRALPPWTWTG